jgi:hypothetical protein
LQSRIESELFAIRLHLILRLNPGIFCSGVFHDKGSEAEVYAASLSHQYGRRGPQGALSGSLGEYVHRTKLVILPFLRFLSGTLDPPRKSERVFVLELQTLVLQCCVLAYWIGYRFFFGR